MPQRDPSCLQIRSGDLALLQQLLAQHTPQAEAWAYGSRVRGDGHETSDLDLVLRWPPYLSQEVPGWDHLLEAIQDSLIPIVVDVHLWPRLPPAFHQNIEADYIVIQTGAPQAG